MRSTECPSSCLCNCAAMIGYRLSMYAYYKVDLRNFSGYNEPSYYTTIQSYTIHTRFTYSANITISSLHKLVHHKYRLPITFVDYFDFSRNIHGHNTRGSNDLHVISVNKNFGKRSIKHKASMLWNQLPNELKQFLSIRTFADRVKIFLQSAGNMTKQ